MIAMRWKRIGAVLGLLVLAAAGVLLWRDHRESEAKAALAAEIRAARAARPRRPDPVPTAEERETAELYERAIAGIRWIDHLDGFAAASDGAAWTEVPESVAAMLAAHAESLALADEAAARGACRFADTALRPYNEASHLLALLQARGYAALVGGRPAAAAEEVGRLLRVGRHLAAAPPDDLESGFARNAFLLRNAEARAAELLASIATEPDLPRELGSALVACAEEPRGTSDAVLLLADWEEEYTEGYCLRMLGPDAGEWLEKMEGEASRISELLSSSRPKKGIVERIEDRLRGALRRRWEVPTAAEMRMNLEAQRPVLAAMRRRDFPSFAPGGAMEKEGGAAGTIAARWFRLVIAHEARVAVARAAAAVRAFPLQEGRPPRSLEEAAPPGAPEAILDPVDGKPLTFETDGTGWRVASRVWRRTTRDPDGTLEEDPPVEVRFPRGPRKTGAGD